MTITIILANLTNNSNRPIVGATVDFLLDIRAPPVATMTTNAEGRFVGVLDPGSYIVRITNGLQISNLKYVVKAVIPRNFSGIEMITGIPGSTGQFMPQRFRNSPYSSSNIGITNGLVQKVNWRLP